MDKHEKTKSFTTLISYRYFYRSIRPRLFLYIGFIALIISISCSYLIFIADMTTANVIVVLLTSLFVFVFSICLYWFVAIAAISVFGVVLGITVVTVLLGVTTGFQNEFRKKILGVNAHVLVMKRSHDFVEYRSLQQKLMLPNVIATAPFVFAEMLAISPSGNLKSVAVKGVDSKQVTKVLDIEKHIVDGNMDSLDHRDVPHALIGKGLAESLNISVGDMITVISPLAYLDIREWFPSSTLPKEEYAVRIGGVFQAGFNEYDQRLMYMNYKTVQHMLGKGDVVMGIEMKLRNFNDASEVTEQLEQVLKRPEYFIQDWKELNAGLFSALSLQKTGLLIVSYLIVGVALFNLLAVLAMMIVQRAKEITIFKSLGAQSRQISLIFCRISLMMGLIGTLLGMGVGLLLCAVISRYRYTLDASVYLIDRLPVSLQMVDLFIVIVVTLIISGVATLIPSSTIASLLPVQGLRKDWQG